VFSVAVTIANHAQKAQRRYDTAARAGIVNASQILLNALKDAYHDYYTTQEYRSTLQIRQSLRRANPEKGEGGWYTIVGVPTAEVVPRGGRKTVDRGKVALYWEMGWRSKKGRFWRVPIAVPAANAASKAMRDGWARVVKRYMEAP
jgi:hypothetical protein